MMKNGIFIRFNRILETKSIWILCVIFGISVASKILIIPFMGAVTFPNSDEHLFIEMAKSFFYDRDFVSNAFSHIKLYIEVLYPIIISPAYFFYSPGKIVTIFRIIGTLLMSSAVFPAYKLGLIVLNDKKQALLVSVIAILIPEMTYSLSVTQEVLYYPLFLYAMYLIYQKISGKPINTLYLGFILFLLWTCKAVGMTVFVGYIVYLFFELSIINKFKNTKEVFVQIVIVIIVVFGLKELLSLFICYANTGSFEMVQDFYLRVAIERIKAAQSSFISDFANGTLYYLFYTTLAFLVFPVLIPFDNLKEYNLVNRKFLLFLFINFIITVFTVVSLIYIDEGGVARDIQRVHLRYFFPLFIPIFILLIKLDFSKLKINIFCVILTSFLILYYIFFNPKFMIGSIIDSKSLLLIDDINNFIVNGSNILALFIVIFLIFAGFVLYKQFDGMKSKKFIIWIIVLILTINQAYATYKTYLYYTRVINGIERRKEYSYLSHLINSVPGTPIVMYPNGDWWFDLLYSTQSNKDFIRVGFIENTLKYTYNFSGKPNFIITPKNMLLNSKINGVYYVKTDLKLFDVYKFRKKPSGIIKIDYNLLGVYPDGWLMDDARLLISGDNRGNQVEVSLELTTNEHAGNIIAVLKDSTGNITSVQVSSDGTKVKLFVERNPGEDYFNLKLDYKGYYIPKDMPDIFGENDDARKLTYRIERIIVK